MTKRQTAAQSEYEAAVEKLGKFCEDHTDLTPIIMDEEYPIRVQFIPDNQLTLFGNENIDENGEINDLTVSVGLSTAVKSTLKFKMDSKLLKKMIKLAETVGTLYYHAFRAQEGDRTKAKRPDYESDGYDENGNLISSGTRTSARPATTTPSTSWRILTVAGVTASVSLRRSGSRSAAYFAVKRSP